MWEDPIVAEVHRTREKLAAEHNYDLGAFLPMFGNVRHRSAAGLYRKKNEPNQRLKPTGTTNPVL